MDDRYIIEVERNFSEETTIEDLIKQIIVKKYKKDISFNRNLCYNGICNTAVVDSH